MTDTKRSTTNDHTEEAAATFRTVLALDHLAGNDDRLPEPVQAHLDDLDLDELDIHEALDCWALDITLTQRLSHHADPVVETVRVVTGTGGPHSQFVIQASGDGVAEAWSWGYDGYVSVPFHCPTLAQWLIDGFENA